MNEKLRKLCITIFIMVHFMPVYSVRFINSDSIFHDSSIPRLKRLTNSVYPSNYNLNEIVEVMPNKRAALLLDRIMVALQKAVDDGKDMKLKGYYPESGSGLQRRGQEKGKVYWRCYFNAVTCF